jgi:hypothetical protein
LEERTRRWGHLRRVFSIVQLSNGFFLLQPGNIVPGVVTPVLAKHSKSFSLIDCVSVGIDRMQRNFEPMRKQVEAWQSNELTAVTAKVVIYEAFVEGRLEAPKHLARTVLRAEVRGVPSQNDLESVECFHISIQGTRAEQHVVQEG